jgi:hypothetical protein
MTAGELSELLRKYPPHAEVRLIDGEAVLDARWEGNHIELDVSYRPVDYEEMERK